MRHILLKTKIHDLIVEDTNVEYEGSITLSRRLIKESGLLPYEKVLVVNLNTGQRAETYVIEGDISYNAVCLNGGIARMGTRGDKILLLSFGLFDEDEITQHKPCIIRLKK